MAMKRPRPNPDAIMCAWVWGTASRHVARADPQGPDRQAAIAELRECVLDGRRLRTDLLSQEAGLLAGLASGETNDWHRRQLEWMSALCREAAGDQLDRVIVEQWRAIGIERAAEINYRAEHPRRY